MRSTIELYNRWMLEQDYYPHLLPAYRSMVFNLVKRLGISGLGENDVVVDLGSGLGYTCQVIRRFNPRCRLVAVDPSLEMLEKLKELTTLGIDEFVNCSAQELSARLDDQPAVILSSFALHHVPHEQKQETIAGLYSLLQNGGRLGIGEISVDTAEEDALGRFNELVDFYSFGAKYIARHTSVENGIQELKFMGEALEGRTELFVTAEQWMDIFDRAGFRLEKPWFSRPKKMRYFNLIGRKQSYQLYFRLPRGR